MKVSFRLLAVTLAVSLALPPALQNDSYGAQQYSQFASAFTDDELDQMLAPIALYPDPLLAQILPAASFGDQISQAQSLLNGQVDESLIEGQNWDLSVKAIAHYPSILALMVQQPDWTAAVGQAYVSQEPDVERSIQRLRAEAMQAGTLQSTLQQQVIVEADVIRVEPAQPQVIYVPVYDPAVVWGYPGAYGSGLGLTFGSGFAIGAWLNRDWDWHGHGPYYHAWRGGGWIGANRSFVDTHNHFYVNDQFRDIKINRNVVNRNISGFRSQLDRDASFRSKPSPGDNGGNAPVGGATQRVIPSPATPAPVTRERPRPTPPQGAAAPARPMPPPQAAPVLPRVTPPPVTRENPRPAPPPQGVVPARPTPPPQAAPVPPPVTPPLVTRGNPRAAPPPQGAAAPARPMPPPQAAPVLPRVTPPPVTRENPRPAPPPQGVVPPRPMAPPQAAPVPPPVTPPPVTRENPRPAPPSQGVVPARPTPPPQATPVPPPVAPPPVMSENPRPAPPPPQGVVPPRPMPPPQAAPAPPPVAPPPVMRENPRPAPPPESAAPPRPMPPPQAAPAPPRPMPPPQAAPAPPARGGTPQQQRWNGARKEIAYAHRVYGEIVLMGLSAFGINRDSVSATRNI
jgi:Protein of unknown function (DUF3300)